MQPPKTIDTLIEARWIIPIEPDGVTLDHHAVAIDDQKVVAVLPADHARRLFQPTNTVRLPQHVLIPGFVNLHAHAAMSLLRGYADDISLMDWLNRRIWPAEARHASAAFVREGTLLACAEMLRGGITSFNDMYFYPEAAAEAAVRVGMRAVLGILTIEFPTGYAADADDYLSKGLAARDALLNEPLISFCMAPHAPYTVADASLERISTLAAQLDLPIHMHVHETRGELEDSLKQYGVRPLRRLHRLGILGPNLIAVHAVHLDSAEIELLAAQACNIAHCPTSNMKLSSGIAPIASLDGRGVNIGLGTDGAASNNRLDMFREMNHAALLAKVASGDATVLDAHRVLRMATLGGALALGQEAAVGSISVGKHADLCAVRLDDPSLLPCFEPASHLVHCAGREHVSHVWVAGEMRVDDGRLLTIDTAELQDIGNLWQNKLDFA